MYISYIISIYDLAAYSLYYIYRLHIYAIFHDTIRKSDDVSVFVLATSRTLVPARQAKSSYEATKCVVVGAPMMAQQAVEALAKLLGPTKYIWGVP